MENFWVMNYLAVPELRAAPVPVWHKLPAPRPAPTACCVAGAGVGVGVLNLYLHLRWAGRVAGKMPAPWISWLPIFLSAIIFLQ